MQLILDIIIFKHCNNSVQIIQTTQVGKYKLCSHVKYFLFIKNYFLHETKLYMHKKYILHTKHNFAQHGNLLSTEHIFYMHKR